MNRFDFPHGLGGPPPPVPPGPYVPQAQAVVRYRWVVLVPGVGVTQGTDLRTDVQIQQQIVKTGEGARPGSQLLIVREDGIVVGAYGAARTAISGAHHWIPIWLGYHQ